jgi:hypothetical protein
MGYENDIWINESIEGYPRTDELRKGFMTPGYGNRSFGYGVFWLFEGFGGSSRLHWISVHVSQRWMHMVSLRYLFA